MRQVFLVGKEKNDNKEKDKVSAQYHHDAEHIERKRHIGNQLIDILDIAIAEVRHILFQHPGRHLRLGLIARSFCLAVSGESTDSRLSLFNLLLGGERRRTVFQRITALQQVVDARHESIRIALGKQREEFGDFHPEKESVLSVACRFLIGIEDAESHQPAPSCPW